MPLNAAELLLAIETPRGTSLRHRLTRALRDAIRSGRLPPGMTLPSTRVLAADLGMSRGVVVEAYAQLVSEGFLLSRPGAATTVAALPDAVLPEHWRAGRPPLVVPSALDLRPGPPDLSLFPRTEWSRAVKRVLAQLPPDELGYVEPWGTWELRVQLAEYLSRVRGAMTAPHGIVIVSGVTQGITLLCRLLLSSGHDSLAVEDPSNAVQRRLLTRLGIRVVDVPVDDEGLRVDELARTGTRAVLCTPAHQYPLGVALSARRRDQLLRWAADVDGLVLEDDYNADFRYSTRPLGCLQGMDPRHVALLGSVSKTLAPALRLGWVVTPPGVLPALRAAKRDDDYGSDGLTQHVLAQLLRTGSYDRHVRSARRRYRARRSALLAALGAALPGWTVLGIPGGLHLTVALPDDVDERRLVAATAELGVTVLGLKALNGTRSTQAGLVLSLARSSPDMLHEAVQRISRASLAWHRMSDQAAAAADATSLLWEQH